MAEEAKDKKKSWFVRHKVLTLVLGVIVFIVLVSALGGGDKAKTNNGANANNNADSSDTAKADTEKSSGTPKVGEPARDGKFEFVVKSLECGKPSVGTNQYLTKTAQGQYCLLTVSVKNIGDEKQSLLSSNQKLLDTAGKEYSADDTATMYAAPEGSASWYSDINPGNSVEGAIVFDVPKDVTPTVAQLHDSAFSGGVKVSLQ